MNGFPSHAEGCRLKAEELRMMAENTTARDCRELLLRLAADYERMAETLEKLTGKDVDLPFRP